MMRAAPRRPRPSWRAAEARPFRPEVWLIAAAVVGMLLVEVWQSSRVAELSLRLDRTRTALVQDQAHYQYACAELDRRATRAELAPLASGLGLAPADAQQIVMLPADYLAADRPGGRQGRGGPLLAWAERASRLLVPEATARDRAGH